MIGQILGGLPPQQTISLVKFCKIILFNTITLKKYKHYSNIPFFNSTEHVKVLK